MIRESLDRYDILPEDMMLYLRHNGKHFNRKLCEFAVSKMYRKDKNTDEKTSIKFITKEKLNQVLEAQNVILERNQLYDAVYVANMCKADFLGSSIEDDKHFALYIKDVIDDPDAYDGLVFNRWYADMCQKGIAIDWEEML